MSMPVFPLKPMGWPRAKIVLHGIYFHPPSKKMRPLTNLSVFYIPTTCVPTTIRCAQAQGNPA